MRADHLLDALNRETRADEIFSLCRDELSGGCDTPYHLVDPVITKTRPTTCPFGGDICLPNTPSFEITHWNISPLVMGVNSRSRVLINQRLTCVPITLDPFLWKYKDGSVIYVPKLSPGVLQLSDNISLTLTTLNGPNKFSNESSGRLMFTEKGPFDLTVLPGLTAGTNYFELAEPLILNDFLQRNDSQSFLVILRAGLSQYSGTVDDPFFSSHNKENLYPDQPERPVYIADYEATALGCIEQFKYCFLPSSLSMPCTDWGARDHEFSAILNYLVFHYTGQFNDDAHSLLEHTTDQNLLSVNEMLNLFKLVPARFAIYDYLASRILINKMIPLKRPKRVVEYNRWLDDNKEQWIVEVETWFMKALLSGILAIQDGALYSLLDPDPGFSDAYLREWKLCGRILFHSPDFTNINWLGLWTTIIAATVIVLVGGLVNMIPDHLEHCSKLVCRGVRDFLSFLKKLLASIRNARQLERQAGRVWNALLLFNSLSRVRPWYNGRPEPNGAFDETEMNDLGISPMHPWGDDLSRVEEYSEADNPI
jgi:hypothetical protein